MNRAEAIRYIAEKYGASPEYLWMSSPDSAVFRHSDNRKWFAIMMRVGGDKLGPENSEPLDIMNVKCDTMMIGSLCMEKGFYPAYHMNKLHWISIALDGTAADATICSLIDSSFAMTAQKPRKISKKSETRVERIVRMEGYFDTLAEAFLTNPEEILSGKKLSSMLKALEQYYTNGQWGEDFDADERGELPSELKRGVLSEDGLYNLLMEIREWKRNH